MKQMIHSIQATLGGLAAAFAVTLACAAPASAQDRATVEGLIYKPMPIAIPEFNSNSADAKAIATQIAQVVRADLESSAAFRLLAPAAFVQKDLDISLTPRFGDWTVIQAQALVVGAVAIDGSKNMTTQFRLYDVFRNQELFSQQYSVPTPENWRRVAHKVADDIYTQLTAESGYFDSRIVFVSEDTSVSPHRRRLAIMDQDGANIEHLISGGDLVQTARFSPNSQTIIYTAVVNDEKNPLIKRTRVFLYDINSGRRELLSEGSASETKFAARFSPDGKFVVFSKAEDGNTDLYIFDVARRGAPRRLTTSPAIDTEPSFSPDGQKIVFTSDRSGTPQLYIMSATGGQTPCSNGPPADACRLTFNQGRYQTPVWSPRGDWIAFARSEGDHWQIGVTRPDGTGERLLTDAFLDEGPTWSPNGRVIAFARTAARGAGSKIWTIDFSGRNLRQLKTPNDASDPAWSPLLK
jgi:TolB protein